jgi:hypothetical protein
VRFVLLYVLSLQGRFVPDAAANLAGSRDTKAKNLKHTQTHPISFSVRYAMYGKLLEAIGGQRSHGTRAYDVLSKWIAISLLPLF